MNKMEEMADQQLTGFIHAKEGYDVESLVLSMGLTEKEWETIKKETTQSIPDDIKTQIDNIFKGD